MPIERQGDRRRGAPRWFDELVVGELECARWLERVDEEDRTTFGPAIDKGDSIDRPGGHDEEDRPSVQRAEVRLAAFDEPAVGKGFASAVRLRLLNGPGSTGHSDMSFAVQRRADDEPFDLGWQGPASGRLLLATTSFDFRAGDGSHVARSESGSVLRVVLDSAWVDRDETPGELLASLHGVLVMREE